MKKTLFIISIFFYSIAFSQNIEFGIQSGIGLYRMKELKGLNTIVLNSLPFQAKIISNYPPNFYYKPIFLLSIKKFNVGFQTLYYSSGSRISSKDYSGEYLFDTKIRCIAPSIYSDYFLFSLFGKYRLSLFSEEGITFSTLNLMGAITVNNQDTLNLSSIYNTMNYYIEPGLKFGYKIFRFVSLELNTSYFFQIGNNIFKTEENEIINPFYGTIGTDWNGLRVGLSILVTIPLKESTK